jgi:hypothetical protein
MMYFVFQKSTLHMNPTNIDLPIIIKYFLNDAFHDALYPLILILKTS